MPGSNRGSTSRASAFSLVRYAPMRLPNSTCVPASTSDTMRSFGYAPAPRWPRGRPKRSSFAARSATSSVLPSRHTSRQPRNHAPRVDASATGPTSSSCNSRKGSWPSRVRACEIAESVATATAAHEPPSHRSPSSRQRSTSR